MTRRMFCVIGVCLLLLVWCSYGNGASTVVVKTAGTQVVVGKTDSKDTIKSAIKTALENAAQNQSDGSLQGGMTNAANDDSFLGGKADEAKNAFYQNLLFNTTGGAAAKSDLDNGRIPKNLRDKFSDEGIPLSNNASVSGETATSWLITSDGKGYLVKLEGQPPELRIYDSTVRPGVGADALNAIHWFGEYKGATDVLTIYIINIRIFSKGSDNDFNPNGDPADQQIKDHEEGHSLINKMIAEALGPKFLEDYEDGVKGTTQAEINQVFDALKAAMNTAHQAYENATDSGKKKGVNQTAAARTAAQNVIDTYITPSLVEAKRKLATSWGEVKSKY